MKFMIRNGLPVATVDFFYHFCRKTPGFIRGEYVKDF